jgi:Na+-transporting NADH:ubiquinone oxidoreductase subunit NqrC
VQFFFTLCVICAAFVAAAAVVLSHVRFSMHKEKQVCSTLGAETLNRMKFSHEHEQGNEHEQSVRPALRLRNVCCKWRVEQQQTQPRMREQYQSEQRQ